MNFQKWTIRPDVGNDKPNLEIGNKVLQEQAEVLSQELSMTRMARLFHSEGRTGFTVLGLGENVKCVDKNDTWQLQEL